MPLAEGASAFNRYRASPVEAVASPGEASAIRLVRMWPVSALGVSAVQRFSFSRFVLRSAVRSPVVSGLVVSTHPACAKKCASSYMGERFGGNSVGGKWLMGEVLRIPLTLIGHGNAAVRGCNYFAELL